MDAARSLASLGWILLIAGLVCIAMGQPVMGAGVIVAGVTALVRSRVARRRPPR
jgi:hypothetical protein